MKVLVTGASGQVGAAVASTAPAYVACLAPPRSQFDLTDPDNIVEFLDRLQPELIINSGAYTDVEQAEGNEHLAMRVNADAPAIMARWLEPRGGRLIQLSTDYVFDGTASTPYHPSDLCNPLSVYGRSKARGEQAAGDSAIILRTSAVHTAGGHNFVRTMLRLMQQGQPIKAVSDQIFSPSWAPEIARTVWALATAERPGIFHHCDQGSASWHEFAVAIGEEAQSLGMIERVPKISPVSMEDYPAKARRPRYSVLDDSETRKLVGDTVAHWRVNLQRMLSAEIALG